MKKALIVIDLQNDYFPNGKFPLWNAENTLSNIEKAIENAKSKNIPIIIVQHIADSSLGIAPFFNKDTKGVEIHSRILSRTPEPIIVIKSYADSFHKTNLEAVLEKLECKELLLCGMMTQNCVTHTALSKSAEKYKISVLTDCCTTVNEMLHNIALHAISTRISLVLSEDAI